MQNRGSAAEDIARRPDIAQFRTKYPALADLWAQRERERRKKVKWVDGHKAG